MSFDFSTLVTDRTQADVEARNDKGTYQATDLNRVTAAMKDLAERFSVLGYVTDYQDVQTGGGILPEGYTELEYIESSGTQYIDTGVKPNQDTRVVFDYFPVATKNTTMFGSRTSTSSNDRFLVLHANDNDKLRSDYGGTNVDTGTKPTSRTVIDKNKAITTIGDRSWTNSAASFSGTYPMTLCALNNGGSIASKSSIRLYSCQIYDNGTLTRDYIPCTSAEGTVGLYDLVKKQFYGNAGTGEFLSGSVVDPYGNDEHTLLLLHGEDLTDSSFQTVPVTNKGVVVSGDQSKFGGKSLYFNGSSCLKIVDGSFIVGTKDFTVDWWEYRISSNGTSTSINLIDDPGYSSFLFRFNGTKFYSSSGLASWDVNGGTDVFTRKQNDWVHTALVRKGKTVKIYVDGKQVYSFTGPDTYSGLGRVLIGCHAWIDQIDFFTGYIDEFRISDIARWTAEFTPPTEPYKRPQNEAVRVWSESDAPTTAQMKQYLANVEALRRAIAVLPTTPATPESMELLDYIRANEIEQILADVDDLLKNMAAAWYYSVEVYCGEV